MCVADYKWGFGGQFVVEVNKRWTGALLATSTKRTSGPNLLLVLAHPQSEISIISVVVTIIATTSAAPAAQHQLSMM